MKTRTVDINRATQKTLEGLPLIGPKRAARIIAYRSTYGWFGSVEDLDRVPGIGEAILRRISPYLTT
jgi:competence protein ComEA